MVDKGQIEHVVVLMMENRSFDQMLGSLRHGGLQPTGPQETNHLVPHDAHSPLFEVHPYADDHDVTADPSHTYAGISMQLQGAGPPINPLDIDMSGFAADYATRLKAADRATKAGEVLGYHTRAQAPALTTLAREFTTCVQWFASVPGETWPNRMFAHSGFSHGYVKNNVTLYRDPTVFGALSDAHVPWAVYAGDVPQSAAYLDVVEHALTRLNPLSDFFEDVAGDTLPAYSFLEPRHLSACNSQHPPHSVLLGDALIRQVYDALAANPRIWSSLLFLVTYDEHGGFYDRQVPPAAIPPVPGQTSAEGFDFAQYGVRVPAVLVSPWSRRGDVAGTTYDHTSIIRTVYEVFGLPGHLKARDQAAHDVLGALRGTRPRDPVALPRADAARMQNAVAAQTAAAAASGTSDDPDVVARKDLDGFQRSLVSLTQRLDRRPSRGPTAGPTGGPTAAPTAAPTIRPEPEQGDIDLKDVVARFQARHVGTRARRIAVDHG